jgi:hypothetical protein
MDDCSAEKPVSVLTLPLDLIPVNVHVARAIGSDVKRQHATIAEKEAAFASAKRNRPTLLFSFTSL